MLTITKETKNDSIKMEAYNKLRRATYYNDPNISKEYTKKYLEFASKRKDSHHIVLVHFFLGNAFLMERSYQKALENYLVGANYYDKNQDTARLTSVYNLLVLIPINILKILQMIFLKVVQAKPLISIAR